MHGFDSHTSRPGFVIRKKGFDIEKIKKHHGDYKK